jgi:hypothetical protein
MPSKQDHTFLQVPCVSLLHSNIQTVSMPSTITVHAVSFIVFGIDDEHWSCRNVYSAFYDKSAALEFKAYLNDDDVSSDVDVVSDDPTAIIYTVETSDVYDHRTPAPDSGAGAGFAGLKLHKFAYHDEYRMMGIYDTKEAARTV